IEADLRRAALEADLWGLRARCELHLGRGLVQQIAEIEAWIFGEISEERARERRVRAWIAVRRELARPSGIGGDHRAVSLAKQREAAKAAALTCAARRALRKRIVATGVEHHDLLRRRPGRLIQLLKVDRADRGLVFACDLHIGRRKQVL